MLSMDESAITANDFQIRTIGQKKLLSFAGWYDYSFVQILVLNKIYGLKILFGLTERLHVMLMISRLLTVF